jgi:dimeric dUTPase (all-alpha-NTP-PPase superfamily)
MKKLDKIKERRSSYVVGIHFELMASLNKRLEEFCVEYGWSKRKVIEDALLCWLNQRDMEIKSRKDVKVEI